MLLLPIFYVTRIPICVDTTIALLSTRLRLILLHWRAYFGFSEERHNTIVYRATFSHLLFADQDASYDSVPILRPQLRRVPFTRFTPKIFSFNLVYDFDEPDFTSSVSILSSPPTPPSIGNRFLKFLELLFDFYSVIWTFKIPLLWRKAFLNYWKIFLLSVCWEHFHLRELESWYCFKRWISENISLYLLQWIREQCVYSDWNCKFINKWRK